MQHPPVERSPGIRGAARVLAPVVGGLGVIQVTLGVTFWTGNADFLIPVHMVLGTTLVLCLWSLAALGVAAPIPLVFSLAGFAWGALTVIYGMAQEVILTGSLHWIAQVLHLAVGMVAVLIAVLIARAIQDRRPPAAAI